MNAPFLYALVIAMAGVAPLSAFSAESQCGGNAIDVGRCQDSALRAANERLNAVYSMVTKMFDAGEVDSDISYFPIKKAKAIAAERSWIRYRDAQCGAEGAMIIPGSGVATVTGRCLLLLTQERIGYLESLADELRGESKLCENDASACKLK